MTRFRLIPAFLLICLTALALIQIGGCANIVPPSGGREIVSLLMQCMPNQKTQVQGLHPRKF